MANTEPFVTKWRNQTLFFQNGQNAEIFSKSPRWSFYFKTTSKFAFGGFEWQLQYESFLEFCRLFSFMKPENQSLSRYRAIILEQAFNFFFGILISVYYCFYLLSQLKPFISCGRWLWYDVGIGFFFKFEIFYSFLKPDCWFVPV